MGMADPTEVPRFTVRWFLTALAVGFVAGILLDRVGLSRWASLASASKSGAIGMVNSVVVWGGCMLGFRLLARLPNRGTPAWIAARSASLAESHAAHSRSSGY